MDTISQNKNIVTSFIDALFTKGDLGAVDEYLAGDYVDHDPPMGFPASREGMRAAAATFRAAFPDWHSDIGFYVEEGDLVVENFTASGTQQGEIFGVPAVGPHRQPARDQHLAGPRRPHRGALGTPGRSRPHAPARPGPPALTAPRYKALALALARACTYRRVMADAIMKRQVTALIGRCYAGLDVADLRDEVLRRLRRIVSVDAAFFGTVDPQTLLFTSAVAEEPLGAATPLFLDNEYGREDVNKFAALAEAADPVELARPGHPRPAAGQCPLPGGDEPARPGRRAARGSHQRQAVLGRDLPAPRGRGARLRRPGGRRDPADRPARGRGPAARPSRWRRSARPQTIAAPAGAPGIILLDQDLALMTMSPEAAQWLAEIDEADWPSGSELPMAVYAAAARLARLEQGAAPPQLADTIRLRSRAGQWLSLHASRLGGGPAPQIGIVIEPTPAAQLSSLLLSAYGLTGAQSRVVALVIRGHSTRQIVEELHISANTVQEHLTAAFDKFGVRSRRELVAAMLTGRPG